MLLRILDASSPSKFKMLPPYCDDCREQAKVYHNLMNEVKELCIVKD